MSIGLCVAQQQALTRRSADLVGRRGAIETYGRPETEALLEGLEVVPRRREPYRGIVVENMDLRRILAHAPRVVIVEEIPHTNIPGSRNSKRYEDVVELLDAGINVIGAIMNVQHLESVPMRLVREAADFDIALDRVSPEAGAAAPDGVAHQERK